MYVKLRVSLIAIFSISLFGCAQPSKVIIPQSYTAYKTAGTIVIDGDDSDNAWNKAAWTPLFVDIEGEKVPKYSTKVKMLWDNQYYYILAKIDEPHVWGYLKQRDTIIFYNNDFEVFIDPDGDTHNYYELEINALNTVWDLFISKPYREDDHVVLNDWTLTGLKSAVKVNGTINNPTDIDQGWILEIAIPWAAYKTSYYDQNVPENKFWRVNFSRVNWQHAVSNGKYMRKKDNKGDFLPEYNWVWSPMGVINMHEPEKWGYVYFSSKETAEGATFSMPPDEKLKWELYSIYRAQKKRETNTTPMNSISKHEVVIDGKTIPVKLEAHISGFNISAKSPFSNKTLIIKEDGKIISK
ncbi:hypothetical protein CJ739_2386 [Mariniflexile rhizosphaerae]|uniref:carbohydrate-binding family 9-like protein n=1 Tax=unclassified Mariniflexile TaxID=2643887 RepID=UPI000E3342A0|nr:carbohydrate-binding family 9-like protein [Mariniflexile sp. TRM1-10]AXP81459.1 hypothetical protein CJ739_2386 [Mariniflexile sp. TRM1-10]